MIDFHTDLVATLTDILPTYYELHLSKDCSVPCISYMLRDDYSEVQGDTVGYDVISYQIKIWSTKLSDLQDYAIEIDEALRELGFRRTSTREIYDMASAMKQKVMVYETRTYEKY